MSGLVGTNGSTGLGVLGQSAQGTVGSVTYRAGDGTELLCGWNNPFIGDNMINYSVGGAHPGRYDCRVTCGGGNRGAHMRWVIFPLGPPFSLRRLLGERGISNLRDLASNPAVRLAGFSTKQLLGLMRCDDQAR